MLQGGKFEYWDPETDKYDGTFWTMIKNKSFKEINQSTGLKDKNGIEIFEGDILKITEYKPGTYSVIWDDYRVAWWGKNVKERDNNSYDDDFYQLLGDTWQTERREVIGNIYEKEDKPVKL